VLFHVYGEPWSQTALDAWGGGDYLWHLLLTQRGYVVASVDNRGTPAPRGPRVAKSVYGAVGVLASRTRPTRARARAAAAGRRLGARRRVGLERRRLDDAQPALPLARAVPRGDVGGAGGRPAALRHDLPGALHGTPGENAEGYRQASPITHAGNLRGDLLVVHGTGDDNVHYQGTERLVNALVAANRPFTMMAYPNRSHCVCEGAGTSRHLFELLTRYLETHLPAGPAGGR
jgi:dipeptidyl-peptidase-4